MPGNEFLFMFGDMNISTDSALGSSDAKASKGIPDIRSRFEPSFIVKAKVVNVFDITFKIPNELIRRFARVG
jgi:hypothetical protein